MSNSSGFATLDTYHFILNWGLAHKGNTPSQRQISAGCGFSNATAHHHKRVLIEQGLLEIIDGELCIVRSTFTLPPNAYEVSEIERIYPNITEMKHIPKDIDFSDLGEKPSLADLGIMLGEAADEQFLLATYPEGWRYLHIKQDDPGVDMYHLVDTQKNLRASLRFNKMQYTANIYFWGL